MSAASGSRSHVGKVAFISSDRPETFGGFMAVVRALEGTEPRYVFHHLASTRFAKFLDESINSTTINNLSADIVGRFPIPLPPLEEQRRIAHILDSFDALVNDLSSGLPAEIAARRQQYEHYRDRLLTFREAP
jgi:type I restriction enzyme S subunit